MVLLFPLTTERSTQSLALWARAPRAPPAQPPLAFAPRMQEWIRILLPVQSRELQALKNHVVRMRCPLLRAPRIAPVLHRGAKGLRAAAAVPPS